MTCSLVILLHNAGISTKTLCSEFLPFSCLISPFQTELQTIFNLQCSNPRVVNRQRYIPRNYVTNDTKKCPVENSSRAVADPVSAAAWPSPGMQRRDSSPQATSSTPSSHQQPEEHLAVQEMLPLLIVKAEGSRCETTSSPPGLSWNFMISMTKKLGEVTIVLVSKYEMH